MSDETQTEGEEPQQRQDAVSIVLMIGALGVVFGDIGTSPLYAFRTAVDATGVVVPGAGEVLGILSLMIWTLAIIVSLKYAGFVLRADNNGEGGALALMTLARESFTKGGGWFLVAGLVGAAMFFGDAIITPAISVLSAVEGLEVSAPGLEVLIVPVTMAILIALFTVQSFGTGKVASIFGPITFVWFLTLAGFGLWNIVQAPQVLWAINPLNAVMFLVTHFSVAAPVVGAVFLVVTGAEALYSDLGHFGKRPIVWAWYVVVFPALILNYFGQGAYVLAHGFGTGNVFYLMLPVWARPGMLILAALATVIASQAVITGIFSLASQASQLHLLPRLDVQHTSAEQSGQIFMPLINGLLLAAVLLLVLGFKSSGALASAYGISVTTVMVITSLMLFFVMWRRWNWPVWGALLLVVPLVLIELAFLAANLTKIADGGWVPLLVGGMMAAVMLVWMQGRQSLMSEARKSQIGMDELIASLKKRRLPKVAGTAIFLTTEPDMVPSALAHSLKHYNVLHELNIVLSVVTADQPRVPRTERIQLTKWNDRFMQVILTYGFMENPNVPRSLQMLKKHGIELDSMTTSYFLSRRTLVPKAAKGLARWRALTYIALARNSTDATRYFHLPVGRVVEIGTQMGVS